MANTKNLQGFSYTNLEKHSEENIEKLYTNDNDDYYLLVVDNPENKEEYDEQLVDTSIADYVNDAMKENKTNTHNMLVYAGNHKPSSVATETEIKKECPMNQDFEETMDTFFITNNIPVKVPATVIKYENEVVEDSIPQTIINNEVKDDEINDLNPSTMIKYEEEELGISETIVTQEGISQEYSLHTDEGCNSQDSVQEISDQNLIQVITNDGTILLENNAMVELLINSGQLILNNEEQETQEVILCEDEEPQPVISVEDTNLVLEYAEDFKPEVKETYVCSCGAKFQTIQGFEMHQVEHDEYESISATVKQETINTYICNCGEKLLDPQEFEKHQDKHKDNAEDDIITTVTVLHHAYKTYLCTCGKKFRDLLEFGTHQHNQSFIRETDHKLLQEVLNIPGRPGTKQVSKVKRKHTAKKKSAEPKKRETRNEEKKFECDICHKRFRLKPSMQYHKFIHMNPVSCSHCELIFKDKKTFEYHKVNSICPKKTKYELIQTYKRKILIDQTNGYLCTLCKQLFPNENTIDYHIKTSHVTDANELFCFICGEASPTLVDLQAHILDHGKRKVSRRFPCSQCDQIYESAARLKVHERVHTNERPYACQLCPKVFKTNAHLQTHNLTHTKEKKFSCSVCLKSFALKGNLVAHARKHTGEKPYVCLLCKDAFIDSKQLKKHKLNDHPENNMPWDQFLKNSFTRLQWLAWTKL